MALETIYKTVNDNGEYSCSDIGISKEEWFELLKHSDARPYFDALPDNFRESALLDRFHCFIERWYLPRINKSMIYKGWTMNMKYFSEIMHTFRIQNVYAESFDKLVDYERQTGMREFTDVKRIATAYMKLLFPHWTSVEDVNHEEFDVYCLQLAIHRLGIIRQQCHYIDPEYKADMPAIWAKRG